MQAIQFNLLHVTSSMLILHDWEAAIANIGDLIEVENGKYTPGLEEIEAKAQAAAGSAQADTDSSQSAAIADQAAAIAALDARVSALEG